MMHATTDIYIENGDPICYRLLGDLPMSGTALKVYLGSTPGSLGGAELVVSPRTAVALHALLGEAIEEWRTKLGDRWAEEFPPTLDLGAAAA